MKPLILFLTSLVFFCQLSQADSFNQHELIRRITVFPFSVQSKYQEEADAAWWHIREKLTQDQRFLIASRSFLIKKDVFQARNELTPADSIILAQLLDAHALITVFLKKRSLHMQVYEGTHGQLLWRSKISLHPSLPIGSQLKKASVRLLNDFVASVPYQGYVYIDRFIGKPVSKQGNKKTIRVKVGNQIKVVKGDKVQVIQIEMKNYKPLFQSDSEFKILAEGDVILVQQDVLTVELNRYVPLRKIKEYSLVRIPRENQRLREQFLISDGLKSKISSEYYAPEVTEATKEIKEKKPLVAALTIILNVAVFLLLAF